MKEAFEKIVERLKKGYDKECSGSVKRIRLCDAIEIVNQVAEEYSHRNHDLDIEVSHRNDGWIPCSERLPEKNIKVLVCDKYGEMDICNLTNGLSWMDNYADVWSLESFIAWQPLPTPYKSKGD